MKLFSFVSGLLALAATSPAQTFTTLHSLDYVTDDGYRPESSVVVGGDTVYGTTTTSHSGNGAVFKVNTDGTGFEVLHNFAAFDSSNTDGSYPFADLILDGSTLYGTTLDGGSGVLGTVFKVDTNGTGFAVLHNFANTSTNGANPRA